MLDGFGVFGGELQPAVAAPRDGEPGSGLDYQPTGPYTVVPLQLKSAVDELRDPRNAVASSSEGVVSPARAAQYVGVADSVVQALRPSPGAP